MNADHLLGRGISWPLTITPDGRLARSSGEDNIGENVRLILATNRGERVGVPEFGAGLEQFLFEPNTITTHQLIRGRVEQSLARWEPRIRVSQVDVDVLPDDPFAARVTITYSLVATGRQERVGLTLTLGGS